MTFSLPERCYVRPPVMSLEREFGQFGPPGDSLRQPCTRSGGRSVDNHCAVRMCVALSRAMNSDVLGAYTGGNVHSSRCCAGQDGQRHITGPQDSYNYLRNQLGFEFARTEAGRTGIPRKESCFSCDVLIATMERAGPTSITGTATAIPTLLWAWAAPTRI